MAVAVSIGEARNKRAPARAGGRLYGCDLPILVDGVERGLVSLNIFIPDSTSPAEARALIESGLSVTFNAGA